MRAGTSNMTSLMARGWPDRSCEYLDGMKVEGGGGGSVILILLCDPGMYAAPDSNVAKQSKVGVRVCQRKNKCQE